MTLDNTNAVTADQTQPQGAAPGSQEPEVTDWKAKYEAESALRAKYEKFAKDDKDAAAAWRAHQASAPVTMTDTERELAQYKAAAKHSIPAEYFTLLDGADAEAIEAKAAALVPLIAAQSGAPADPASPVDPAAPAEPQSPVRFGDPAQQGDPSPDEAQVKEAFARQLFGV